MEADLAAAHAVAEAALVVEDLADRWAEDLADQWEEDLADRWEEDPVDRWEEDPMDRWVEDPMDRWAVPTDLGADGIARITLTAMAVACP